MPATTADPAWATWARSRPTVRPATASPAPPPSPCRRSAWPGSSPLDPHRDRGEPMTRETWPGRPFPVGATWTGEDRCTTNFSLFSEHATGVELCLFDDEGNEERVPVQQR